MPRTNTLPSLLALVPILLAGCAPGRDGEAALFVGVADVRGVMQAVTIPASDAIWAAGADEPTTDQDWLAIENAALALAESGNLLLMDSRRVDRGEWVARSREMIAAATLALEAARLRDVDDLLDAGDVIYATCENCHVTYMGR